MEEKYQKIQDFIKTFKELISHQKNLRLTPEMYVEHEGQFKIIDAALIKNNETLAIFEFKAGAEKIVPQDFWDAIPPIEIRYKFLVLSNGVFHKVLNRFSDETNSFETPQDLLNHLTDLPTDEKVNETKILIAKTIEKTVLDFTKQFCRPNHPLSKVIPEITNHFSKDKIEKLLRFDKNGQYYHLTKDIRDLKNFENKFFQLITQKVAPSESIYRYTTLETVFATIDYKSLRLNGIAGMNDISEVGYVESYLDKNFIPLGSNADVEELNKRFILCSSTLKDDLMQWRLYGDDCKGACLVFKVKKNKEIPGLQLRKISYGININGVNYHPELELIKKIMSDVNHLVKESFQFRALSIWKHFFKSFEYQPENEVRLLLILAKNKSIKGESLLSEASHSISKKWCLTGSHKIVNPFITIDIADRNLPIKLTEIVLGNKCPELVTNKKQFEQLLREKSLSNVVVNISYINNYR